MCAWWHVIIPAACLHHGRTTLTGSLLLLAELVLKGRGAESAWMSLLLGTSISHLCSEFSNVPLVCWTKRTGTWLHARCMHAAGRPQSLLMLQSPHAATYRSHAMLCCRVAPCAGPGPGIPRVHSTNVAGGDHAKCRAGHSRPAGGAARRACTRHPPGPLKHA